MRPATHWVRFVIRCPTIKCGDRVRVAQNLAFRTTRATAVYSTKFDLLGPSVLGDELPSSQREPCPSLYVRPDCMLSGARMRGGRFTSVSRCVAVAI
jgi:hypothetical protein